MSFNISLFTLDTHRNFTLHSCPDLCLWFAVTFDSLHCPLCCCCDYLPINLKKQPQIFTIQYSHSSVEWFSGSNIQQHQCQLQNLCWLESELSESQDVYWFTLRTGYIITNFHSILLTALTAARQIQYFNKVILMWYFPLILNCIHSTHSKTHTVYFCLNQSNLQKDWQLGFIYSLPPSNCSFCELCNRSWCYTLL